MPHIRLSFSGLPQAWLHPERLVRVAGVCKAGVKVTISLRHSGASLLIEWEHLGADRLAEGPACRAGGSPGRSGMEADRLEDDFQTGFKRI